MISGRSSSPNSFARRSEKAKVTQFNQWIKNWEEAERLRRFIAVYAEKTQSRAADSQPSTERGSSGRPGRQTDSIHLYWTSRLRSLIESKSFEDGDSKSSNWKSSAGCELEHPPMLDDPLRRTPPIWLARKSVLGIVSEERGSGRVLIFIGARN